jgi:hypothetical protein
MSLWLIVAALAAQGEEAAEPPAAEPVTATDAPAVPPPPEPPEPPAAPEPADAPADDLWVGCPKSAPLCLENDLVAVWPKVRVRTGFEYVDADPDILYVGNNDGFFVDQARAGVEGTFRNIAFFKVTLDGASALGGGGPNVALSPLFAAARDAWISFHPSPWLGVTVGQQNMPADYEAGDDVDAVVPFARKSVASIGVRPGHGNAVSGLSPGRQIGVVIGSQKGAGFGDLGLSYALALANGNGQNISANDNKLPAGYLRLAANYADVIALGVGGRLNPRTVGVLPNLYTETDAVGFVDVEFALAGLELVVEGIGRQTSLSTLAPDAAETGLGATSWIAYDIALPSVDMLGGRWHVKPAVRASYFDPSSAFQTDALFETTFGVRLTGKDLPLSVFADYTLLSEIGDVGGGAAARDLQNNRFTAMMQLDL